MAELIAKATGIALLALFTLANIWLSPFWLLMVLIGCLLQAMEWGRFLRAWLWLSTGQYAVPWWGWANDF